MTKYKQYILRLLKENKEVFDAFTIIHEKYASEPDAWQEKFNKEGKKVQEIVNEYENRLCKQSEKGGYTQFTPKLSEKFREELKKFFPFYDHIGLLVQKTSAKTQSDFSLKKISLSK